MSKIDGMSVGFKLLGIYFGVMGLSMGARTACVRVISIVEGNPAFHSYEMGSVAYAAVLLLCGLVLISCTDRCVARFVGTRHD